MADYCAAGDLYAHGVQRGAVPNPARLAASALASTDAITLDAHGFDADQPVTLRAEAGGNLPAPLVAGTTYYVVLVSDVAFRLAASAGGAAIPLTTDGENVLVVESFAALVAASISWASRLIDDMLPAHVVPLVAPYPEIVTMTAAELAAGKLGKRGGHQSKALTDLVDAAQKRLARWAGGVPIRGENAPPAANLAASAIAPYLDPTGWQRFGGL